MLVAAQHSTAWTNAITFSIFAQSTTFRCVVVCTMCYFMQMYITSLGVMNIFSLTYLPMWFYKPRDFFF